MIKQQIAKPMHLKPGRLRWEIAVAMLIKIVLLFGLWFLIFRWQDRPASKPDVAEHFALPGSHATADFSSQP
jgi:hypothetical protein